MNRRMLCRRWNNLSGLPPRICLHRPQGPLGQRAALPEGQISKSAASVHRDLAEPADAAVGVSEQGAHARSSGEPDR